MKPAFRTPLYLFALFAISFMVYCKFTEPKNVFASSNGQIVVDGNFYQSDQFAIAITDFKTEIVMNSSVETAFQVSLKIHNLQEQKRLWYHSFAPEWSDVGSTDFFSFIRDEHGNTSTVVPIRSDLDGRNLKRQLLPSEAITEVLLFCNWAPKSKKIKMTLAGNQMTDNKDLVFNIQLP
ncbi:hypothetical protein Pan241w_36900 [Gimesia alba]|uniref:Uncharacterized protein n=1 Tax=Gimesia alba TaxID=2527973 RepID=A0A517RIA0_9PLAN|nr:hypothetical protein [Gimesia alba]QDT43588.1 hypothetical protein Pan241w_36900 [Gimesia alba]